MQAFLWRIASACIPSTYTGHRRSTAMSDRLARVLDGAPEEDGRGASHAPNTEDLDESPALYEVELAKQRAEADAQDKASRLRVAYTQLYEHALQKERDAEDMLRCAEQAAEAAAAAVAAGSSQGVDALMQQVQALRNMVAEAAAEARAFAAQQKADVETLKRSSQQANLPESDQDVEMKRAREGADDDESRATGSPSNDEDPTSATLSNGNHHAQQQLQRRHSESSGASISTADEDEDASMASASASPQAGRAAAAAELARNSFLERARYIPMRLSQNERRLLRLLEAALNVSEYTDKVDILSWRRKTDRIHAQIKDICAILSGLLVAQDYKKGQELIKDKDFQENAEFFQAVFEAGRRYKIMNPDKMRSEYGKLMYLLMDSADPHVQDLLEFKCVTKLKTVYATLAEKGGLSMLEDPLMQVATAEIISADRPRHEVQRDIRAKERAREQLAKRYRSSSLTDEDLLQCLYALSDNNSYLLFNRDPIDRVIQYFTSYFSPDHAEPGFSLAISGGRDGARLTHSHNRQYSYVLQSLTLWREISTDMFRLWYLAEADMLREGNGYRLVDTGQGLNRVQSAPQVSRAMHEILARCQARIGNWVGSSVVHLGDHNVPNAFHFIDKYTQVPRILNPVVLVLETIPKLARDPAIAAYLESAFGGVERCRKLILADFCRHAFDGSGADNFFDAGSCIDGRLTSAWNWCSKLEKKNYYPVFKLAGFTGFDGDFK